MRTLTSILTAAATLFWSAVAYAQQQQPGFVPLADPSQAPMLQEVYQTGDLGSLINTGFKVAISIGAIIAVVRLAIAGYQYMTSDAWGSKSRAKETIGQVVLGLLLLLSVYLILYQINPQILQFEFLNHIPRINGNP